MSATVTTRKKATSFYLDEQLKTDAAKLAALRMRSLNNLVELLLQKEVDDAKKSGELE